MIIWDELFGTFQKEVYRPTYDLSKQINTINPIKVHFDEFTGIFRNLGKARNLKEMGGCLLERPWWKPESDKQSSKFKR